MSPRITGKAAHKMRQYLTVVMGQIELAEVALLEGKANKIVIQHLGMATMEAAKLGNYITAHIQEYEQYRNERDS